MCVWEGASVFSEINLSHEFAPGSDITLCITVNLEIFARIFFSRIALKDIFAA